MLVPLVALHQACQYLPERAKLQDRSEPSNCAAESNRIAEWEVQSGYCQGVTQVELRVRWTTKVPVAVNNAPASTLHPWVRVITTGQVNNRDMPQHRGYLASSGSVGATPSHT